MDLLPKSKISSDSETSSIPRNNTESLHVSGLREKKKQERRIENVQDDSVYRYLADVEKLEYLHLEAEAGVH
jgi:hypothetical protein